MNQDQLATILSSLPEHIADIRNSWLGECADRPALVEPGRTWTYRQLAEAVEDAESFLQDAGVRPGDRVLILCENCAAFVAFFFATTVLNAWPVLINARISPSELDQIREHCGARLALYTVDTSPQAMKHAVRHAAEIRETNTIGRIAVSALNHAAIPEAMEDHLADNVAAMIYTSGTTGLPKGVMLSHRNLLFMAAVSTGIRSVTADDRLVGVLPMSHAVGLAVVLLGTLIARGTLYLPGRFDPAAMLRLLEQEKITILLGNPSIFALLVEYAKLRGVTALRFPDLRVISSSGAPLNEAVKCGVERLFGLTLHNGYGVTECSPTIALTRLSAPRNDLSVGSIFPGIEVKLVDSEGKEVPEGDVGELRVRGPNVMKGYYHALNDTREVIDTRGWFNTRDLARIEAGNLFILGRTKDLIVHFGFNVYPAEVEAILNAHPAVLRSAVLGKTMTGVAGEELVAFIQKKESLEIVPAELEKYAAQRLTAYKRPSRFVFVSHMPLTPTGKVIKAELARML